MPTPAQLPPFLASALGDALPNGRENNGSGSSEQQSENEASVEMGNGRSSRTMTLQADILTSVSDRISDTHVSSPSEAAQTYKLRLKPLQGIGQDEDDVRQADVPLLLVPPLNFDMVCADSSRQMAASRSGGGSGGAIYRSGFPNERNYPFLATLKLRSVIYLAADDVRPNLQHYIDESRGQTRLLHFRLNVNKEPFAEMDRAIVAQALSAILDQRNWPLLIHCNKGKYRVGVITALIRRLQCWSMTSIYEEYARFAGHDRVADEEFIDMFPIETVTFDAQFAPNWLRI